MLTISQELYHNQKYKSISIKLTYLKGRVTGKREKIVTCWFIPKWFYNGQSWARMKLGVTCFFWVFQVATGIQEIEPSSAALRIISRELDGN